VNAIVADFTEAERELVAGILQQRYLKPLLPELADSELKLDPASDEMTICPTLLLERARCPFCGVQGIAGLYRCQFFYAMPTIRNGSG